MVNIGRIHILATAAAILLISGCGGDNGGSPISAPTPTPTPAPSSAPTPTPTPAYTSVCDFTHDEAFPLIGAQVKLGVVGPSGLEYSSVDVTPLGRDTNSAAQYTASDQRLSVSVSGQSVESVDQSNETGKASNQISYEEGNHKVEVGCPGIFISPTKDTAAIEQTIGFTDSSPEITYRLFIGGEATAGSDVSISATQVYSSELYVVRYTPGASGGVDREGSKAAQVTFDGSTDRLSGTLTTDSNQPVTFTINAMHQPYTNQFTGTITSSDGGTGSLTGGFFGAGGHEFGYSFTMTNGSSQLVGVGYGVRN